MVWRPFGWGAAASGFARGQEERLALDGPKNSISEMATCFLADAAWADSMVKRTLVTSPTRNGRRWPPAPWSRVRSRVLTDPSFMVIVALTRCGRADSRSLSARVETPGVMITSSSRVGSVKLASTHWPWPDSVMPGPHQVLLSLSMRSSGLWPGKEREALMPSGETGARLAKWSRVFWTPSGMYMKPRTAKIGRAHV